MNCALAGVDAATPLSKPPIDLPSRSGILKLPRHLGHKPTHHHEMQGEPAMIAGMTYYEICMYFLLYSFLGWVIEVIYHAVTQGKIVNRGFLNGPVCPVYGFGMLVVLMPGSTVSSGTDAASGVSQMSPLLLFLFGMLLATAVELAAGWLLDRLFHARWWDYSEKPLNLHGYICLEFSIIWGLAIVAVVKIVHPLLSDGTVRAIPEEWGWPIMGILYLIVLIDLIITVLTVSGMNRKLKELDQIRRLMRTPSDRLSSFVGNTSLKTAQRIEEGEIQATLAKADLEDRARRMRAEMTDRTLNAQRERAAARAKHTEKPAKSRDMLEKRAEELIADLSGHRIFGTGRLLRAFPSMHHEKYAETLEKLKERIRGKKRHD
jgi:uncharacterized membrane protein